MDKYLICGVVFIFAGCCPPQEGAHAPTAEPTVQEQEEQPPNADTPPAMDEETRREYEETIRRHPPPHMLPSRSP